VQTRLALRQALLALIGDKPLEQVSIRDIAGAAGVGYNTFFRHYTSKETLLKDIVTDELNQLITLSVTTLDASDSLEASRALCRFVAEHDALWCTLLTGGAANTLRDEFIRLLRETAPSRISSSAKVPADIGIKLVAVGTLEVLAWWLGQEQRMPEAQVAEIYERLVAAPVVEAYRR